MPEPLPPDVPRRRLGAPLVFALLSAGYFGAAAVALTRQPRNMWAFFVCLGLGAVTGGYAAARFVGPSRRR